MKKLWEDLNGYGYLILYSVMFTLIIMAIKTLFMER
jgi:hypothetical protein